MKFIGINKQTVLSFFQKEVWQLVNDSGVVGRNFHFILSKTLDNLSIEYRQYTVGTEQKPDLIQENSTNVYKENKSGPWTDPLRTLWVTHITDSANLSSSN